MLQNIWMYCDMTAESRNNFFTHLRVLYRICNKCVCSISEWVMPSGVTYISFCWLTYHSNCIIVLGFYSGMSGRARTVYLSSLCEVPLLSSRFTASALVWFSNFKYLVFHVFISVRGAGIMEWINASFAIQRRGKRVSAAVNKHAITEDVLFRIRPLLCNDAVNT
jgi:hypothetical protein